MDELLRPRYAALCRATIPPPRTAQKTAELIMSLLQALRHCYADAISSAKGEKSRVVPSNTLLTKIVLGTIGCTPAYDTFVIAGLREANLRYSKPSEQHFIVLWNFYRERTGAFEKLQATVAELGLRYPPMKLVDMYFWMRGRTLKE